MIRNQIILITFSLTALISMAVYTMVVSSLEASLFIFFSFLPIFYLATPLFVKSRIDLFQPISFLILNVLLGVSLRAWVMVHGEDAMATAQFFQGQELKFFFPSLFWINVGLFFFLLGYTIRTKVDSRNFSYFKAGINTWKPNKVLVVSIILTLISLYSISSFIGNFSITDLGIANISKKRFIRVNGIKSALGYHRWGASLSQIAYYMLLTYVLCIKKKKSLVFFKILLFANLLLSLFFPIFTNKKLEIAFLFFNTTMIFFYLRQTNFLKFLPLAAGALFLIIFLNRARKAQVSEFKDIYTGITMQETFGSIIHNRNYLGISKVGHIIDGIPNKMEFAYGNTLINWIYTPIPRSIWPNKPLILTGPTIVEKIYGRDWKYSGGVPPSLIGELFWNFGYPGIVIGYFLLGVLSKRLYLRFYEARKNPNYLLIYIFLVYSVAFILHASGFAYSLISLIRQLLPLVLILYIINSSSLKLKFS